MKTIAMVVGMMMASTIIFAQKHKGFDPAAGAAKRSEKMKTELALNDAQFAKVKAINEKFAKDQVQVRRDTSLTRGTAQRKMTKLKADKDSQLKAAMTEVQWAKWSGYIDGSKDHHGKRHQRGGHRR